MGNYPEGMQRFLGIAFEKPASLLDYLPTNTLCVIDEVVQCHGHSDRWLESVEQECNLLSLNIIIIFLKFIVVLMKL
jgi:transcription-repair coupling factor (superfamily II helicase)